MNPASPSTAEHRKMAEKSVGVAVLTVSDTRTLETDRGGALLCELVAQHGHQVLERDLTPDDPHRMRTTIARFQANAEVEAILITGGTGIAPRDNTYETVAALLTKPLPGYGELFRMLSWHEVGPAAMLSRAIAGVVGRTVLFTMPGSTNAVRTACEKLILPELAHIVHEANK
jgi:molybdopterin adenylyltransferase